MDEATNTPVEKATNMPETKSQQLARHEAALQYVGAELADLKAWKYHQDYARAEAKLEAQPVVVTVTGRSAFEFGRYTTGAYGTHAWTLKGLRRKVQRERPRRQVIVKKVKVVE